MLRIWTCFMCFGLLLAACGDDAGADDNGSSAESDGGVPDAALAPRCTTDSECDNDLFCDGEEVCQGGACLPGLPVRCDDGIECTVDRCSEALRECESLPPDLDGDGHVDASCLGDDGEPLGDDCDDADPLRFPGNIEACDDKDDDCNPDTLGEKDTDGDGVLDALCCNNGNCGDDCDDLKPSVNPMATEACDQFDNDCDGDVDEGVSVDMYPDADRDGHGAATDPQPRCPGTVGFSAVDDDCDDDDPEVFEGQFEICDGKDNNCSGTPDEIHQDAPWFLDLDGDGFGDPASTPIFSCERVAGRVLSHNDCRDDDPAIHPAAAELCDAVDNDCNGLKDYNLGVNDFEDDDDDDLADDGCGAGAPDCNDLNGSTGAGLDEICDQADNDCDDKIDEQTAQTVWYLDMDGDGWGVDRGTALARCQPIPGRASSLGDCRDDLSAIHPLAAESCDEVDEDCDGDVDEATDHLCALPNAVAGCNFGSCDVLACFPGYQDVDELDANGCETSVPLTPTGDTCTAPFTDAQCSDGDYCNGREVCVSGLCYYGTPAVCSGPTVLRGDYQISTSFDIQQIATTDTITGDLVVSGTTALRSLFGLGNLKVIGGRLIIQNCNNLSALNGLSGLTSVGGGIEILGNVGLTSLDLPELVTAGSILIENNQGLTALGGFAKLATVHGTLRIAVNPELESVGGFGALRSTGRFEIEENGLLATMGGFGSLERVLTDMSVRQNAHTTIAFPKLKSVQGILDLDGIDFESGYPPNATTTAISLPELDLVGSHLNIRDYQNLTSLDLGKLRKVGAHLSLAVLPELTSVSLPNLTTVGGLLVSSSYSLTSFSAPKLRDIATDMVEIDPYGIADGDLRIVDTAIGSLSFPELLTIDGQVEISYVSGLTSISAPKLHTVGHAFYVYSLSTLESLTMNALTTIGGFFEVYNCDDLVTLELRGLDTVGENFAVGWNGELPSIAALGLRDQQNVLQLKVLGSAVSFSTNSTLCTSEINAFVAALVTNGFAGSTFVSSNAVCP